MIKKYGDFLKKKITDLNIVKESEKEASDYLIKIENDFRTSDKEGKPLSKDEEKALVNQGGGGSGDDDKYVKDYRFIKFSKLLRNEKKILALFIEFLDKNGYNIPISDLEKEELKKDNALGKPNSPEVIKNNNIAFNKILSYVEGNKSVIGRFADKLKKMGDNNPLSKQDIEVLSEDDRISSGSIDENVKIKNKYFNKILKLLAFDRGLMALFVKFLFKEMRHIWEINGKVVLGNIDECYNQLENFYSDKEKGIGGDKKEWRKYLWTLDSSITGSDKKRTSFRDYLLEEPNENDKRPTYERLRDEWEYAMGEGYLDEYFIKRILSKGRPEGIEEKTGKPLEAIPNQVDWVKNSTPQIKKQFIELTFALMRMKPEILEPTIDSLKTLTLLCKTLPELLEKMTEYIDTATEPTYEELVERINEANRKVDNPKANGVVLIWSDKKIILVEVKSYIANEIVNGPKHTKHCIGYSLSSWNEYSGQEEAFRQRGTIEGLRILNKVYYLYDFSKKPTDPTWLYGFTVNFEGRVVHCRNRNNLDFRGRIDGDGEAEYIKSTGIFDKMIDKIGIPRKLITPYTEEELSRMMQVFAANEIITKKDLTTEDAIKAIRKGAEVNVSKGLPLKHAILNNDPRLVKYLLEKGANLEYRDYDINGQLIKDSKEKGYMSYLRLIERQKVKEETDEEKRQNRINRGAIISLLISNKNGLKITTQELLMKVCKILSGAKIFKIIEMVLKSGMDPNIKDGYLLKLALKTCDEKLLQLCYDRGLKFNSDNYAAMRECILQGTPSDKPEYFTKEEFKEEMCDLYVERLKIAEASILRDKDVRIKALAYNFLYFKPQNIVASSTPSGKEDEIARRIVYLLNVFENYTGTSDHKDILEILKMSFKMYTYAKETKATHDEVMNKFKDELIKFKDIEVEKIYDSRVSSYDEDYVKELIKAINSHLKSK